MSFIKKTDSKNHLSAGHRTEIHLEPAIQADVTGLPHERLVRPNPAEGISSDNWVDLPSRSTSKKREIVRLKKRAGLIPGSIFLRDTCIVASNLGVPMGPFARG